MDGPLDVFHRLWRLMTHKKDIVYKALNMIQKYANEIKLDQKYLVSTSVFWIVNSLSCTGRSFVLGLTHVLTGKKWLGNLKIWGRSATTNFLPFTDHLFFEWWTTVNLFKKNTTAYGSQIFSPLAGAKFSISSI